MSIYFNNRISFRNWNKPFSSAFLLFLECSNALWFIRTSWEPHILQDTAQPFTFEQ